MSFLKFQSQQGTSLSSDNDLIDFEIPSYLGGVDLEQSYLNVICEVSAVSAAPAAGAEPVGAETVVYDVASNITFDENLLYNTSLIRNVSLTSQNYGQLESIRRCDVINNVLKHYGSDYGDILGGGYQNVVQTPSVAYHKGSIFRNLVGDGGVSSSNTRAPISIPLKNLLGMGNMTVDLSKLGSLRLHCQANLNTLIPFGARETNADDQADQRWRNDYTSTFQSGPIQAYNYLDFGYVNRNNAPSTRLIYPTPDDIPFWNNQRIKLDISHIFNDPGAPAATPPTAPGGGVFVPNTEYIIASIERVARAGAQALSPGTYRVYFTQDIYETTFIPAPVNEYSGTQMKVSSVAPESLTLSVVQAEIVVKKTAPPPSAGGISYITFKTLQDTTPSTENFSSVYSLDPQAISQLTCFTSVSAPFTRSEAVLNYRLRVNGDDVTNRTVPVNQVGAGVFRSPIHYGILDKTLQRMDRELKNLLECTPDVTNNTSQRDLLKGPSETHGVLVLPCPLPALGGPQLLEINFQNDKAAAHNLAIYQAIRREIRY